MIGQGNGEVRQKSKSCDMIEEGQITVRFSGGDGYGVKCDGPTGALQSEKSRSVKELLMLKNGFSIEPERVLSCGSVNR
jgi:hypothetical protein